MEWTILLRSASGRMKVRSSLLTAGRSFANNPSSLFQTQHMGRTAPRSHGQDKILIFTDENRKLFNDRIGHRAIGVVYHPEYEVYGNYVPSNIGSRYDAFIYIEQTKALKPL